MSLRRVDRALRNAHLTERWIRLPRPALLLLIASAAAFAQVFLFAQILGPGRDNPSNFSDQILYERLGRLLASTGVYAREVGQGGVVPEPLRTFGYPAFLAVLFRTAGSNYAVIVMAQAILLATLPPVAFLMARRLLSERLALLSAWAVALYPPLAYYAALAQSDFFASYMLTIGVAALVAAHEKNAVRRIVLAGSLFGWAALTRPALIVVGLALAFWLLLSAIRSNTLPRAAAGAFLAALLVFPGLSVLYTKINFDRDAMVAVGPGLPLWLGYWQGMWPGRVNNELVALAESGSTTATIERRASELSARPERVIAYLNELKEITRLTRTSGPDELIGVAPELERQDRALAFARTDIPDDLLGYLVRGVTYRTFAFWASEVPVRYDHIDRLPRLVVYSMWIPQLALILLALVGLAVSRRRSPVGLLFGVALVSIWIAHFPFISQPRFSLPVKPLLLILGVAGSAWLVNRGRGFFLTSGRHDGASRL